jgi:transposase
VDHDGLHDNKKNIETGGQEQSIGRSKGWVSSKLHAACDALGNPVRFFVTAGQRSDYIKALDLIKSQGMSGDKGYDAHYVVEAVTSTGDEAVIPPRSQRKTTKAYDKEVYKEKNLIERMFNKLKHFRRVATRYDTLDVAYLAFALFAGIYLWLK